MKKKTFVTMLSCLLAVVLTFQVLPENIVRVQAETKEDLVLEQPGILDDQPETDAEIIYEIDSRREEAVKHFRMSDGSVLAALYSDTVHKYDDNGKLVDIDNTLVENGDMYENTDGLFDVSFAKKPKNNKMVEMSYKGYNISFGIDKIKEKDVKIKNNEKANKQSTLTKTTAQARYDDAFDGIDLVYDLTGSKLKESIVIKEYKDINTFTFTYRFDGLTPVLNEDGSVTLKDGEKEVLEIQAPFMYDAANAESDAIEVTLTEHGGKYEYTLTVDKEWLTSEDRVYPVTIDPTTSTYHNKSKVYDTYINYQQPNYSAYREKSPKLLVGTSNGGGEYSSTFEGYRTYIWFDMPDIPAGSRVSSALLTLYCHDEEWQNYGDIEDGIRMDLYELLPGTQHANDIYWNNKDTLVSVKSQPTDYQCLRTGALSEDNFYYQWNITSLIDSYYETKNSGNIPENYAPGMMLRYADESAETNDFYAGFHSGNSTINEYHPSVTVYYTDTKGIEDYYDYFASSLDDSGVGYVNAFNGSLNYVNTIIAESGTRMPVTVSSYYNSANGIWNFSFNQVITHHPKTDDNPYEYYAYTDADGTVHYFSEYEEKFLDESGSGMILTDDGTNITLTKEGDKGKAVFKYISGKAYISSVEDSAGNKQTYTYDGTKVTSIKDGAGRTITITYSGDKVTGIKDAADRNTVFNYSGNNVTSINYINGKTVTFEYSNSKLSKINASSGAYVQYNYDQFNRVTGIHEYDRAKENINSYTISYEHKNTTRIEDKYNDSVLYQFDFYGKTVSVVDNEGSALYTKYSNMNPTDSVARENYYLRNKLMLQSNLQTTVINYLKNINAEGGTASWSVSNGTFTTNTDEFLGYNSFKVQSGAVYQTVSLKKDTTYTFSSYIKAEDGNSAYLKAEGAGANVIGESITTDGKWERHSITFTATQNGNVKVYMCSNGTALFDCLQLEEGDAMNRINLLVGGNFELNESSWTKSSGAEVVADTSVAPQYSEQAPVQSGNKVLKITSDYMNNRNAYQKVHLNVMDTGCLVLSGWAKADAAPDNEDYNSGKWFGMYAEITYADTNQTKKVIPVEFNTAVRIDSDTSQNSWQYVCAAIPLDSDYVTHLKALDVTIYLAYNKNINTAYFDNIQLFYEEFGNSYSYDAKGNVITAIDSASQKTAFNTSGNDVSSVSDPDGSNYEYVYNDNDLLTQYRSATGVGANYTYDSYGNAIKAVVSANKYTESVETGYYYLNALNRQLYYDFSGLGVTLSANESNGRIYLQKNEDGSFKIGFNGNKYLEYHEYSSEIINAKDHNYGLGQEWFFVAAKDGGYYIKSASTHGKDGYEGDIYLSSTGDTLYISHTKDTVWHLNKVKEGGFPGDVTALSDIKPNTRYHLIAKETGQALNVNNGTLQLCNGEGTSFRFVPGAGENKYYLVKDDATQTAISLSSQGAALKQNVNYSGDTSCLMNISLTLGGIEVCSEDSYYLATDASGNILARSFSDEWYLFEDSQTIETSAEYSANYNGNYLTKQIDALGNTVTYSYDFAKGYMTSQTDAKGNVINYTYNAKDQLTSVSQGGISVSYAYDSNNQLSTITHNGFTYNFIYDALGRNKQTKIGTRLLIDNMYEAETGLLQKSTYGNGDTREYEYDSKHRVTKLTIDNVDRFSYNYDNQGNLHSYTDLVQNITYTYLYDFLGRPVQVRTSSGFRIKLTYDEYNRVSDVKFEFGNDALSTEWRYGKSSVVYGVKYNGTEKISYTYDSLMRRSKTTINTTNPFVTTYGYKDINLDKTTTLLNNISYSNGKGFVYTYDANGNILTIKDQNNTLLANYTYDSLNQLTREDNAQLNKTITYTYDNGGNILSIKEYAFTTGDLGEVVAQKTYSYDNTEWKDLLTNYNGTNITYDTIGNPLNWINGGTFTWSGGRQLTGITKGNTNISYIYNNDDIRTSKIVNGVRTDYYLNGTTIIMQKTGDNCIWFTYDENGLVTGFRYNGNEYYYVKNAQSDIIGIIDSSGSVVANYIYDSWGNHIAITDGNNNDVSGNSSHIANVNPFRYRGYYFDVETGLYYLNSRYYDAKVGRFLNADGYTSTGQGSVGNNMFAYCGNNSVNRADNSGQFWLSAIVTTIVVGFVGTKIVGTVKEAKRVRKELDSLPEPSADITESFRETLRTNANTVKETTENEGIIESAKNFYNKVRDKGEWDLKRLPEYQGTFRFNDLVVQGQDIGNINFGYTGKALGLPDSVLLSGAGFAQIMSGEYTFWFVMVSNGDDLRDQLYIMYGIMLYKEDH